MAIITRPNNANLAGARRLAGAKFSPVLETLGTVSMSDEFTKTGASRGIPISEATNR